jgi:hypothetical protein
VAVSVGGAPNGHEAEVKLDPLMSHGKDRKSSKFVMECRQSYWLKKGGERKSPLIRLRIFNPAWGRDFERMNAPADSPPAIRLSMTFP